MPSVADALRAFAPAYLKRFGDDVPVGHRKVLNVITRCRTGELGSVVYECDSCGRHHWAGRSCGNRHCPSCQFDRTQAWLNKQSARLLPVPYFCVTFTVPAELRMALRAHQAEGYRALFEAAAEALRDVGAKTRALKNCELGYFGVLHTWGRNPMVYHPHLHFVVASGGVRLDKNGQPEQWCATSDDFLMHHGTLIRVYRGKLRDKLSAAGVTDGISRRELSAAWKKKSVVDIKPVGDGRAVLKYLAPYVYRVAISDKRIVKVDDSHVTFTMTPSGTKHTVTRRVTGEEFVRGFVQHVLPTGFHKVRYYGWLHPRRKLDLDEIRWLACVTLGLFFLLRFAPRQQPNELPPLRCVHCGGDLRLVMITFVGGLLLNHRQPFLDSG
ncbi:MAG: transposase [Fuerstiella sp.]